MLTTLTRWLGSKLKRVRGNTKRHEIALKLNWNYVTMHKENSKLFSYKPMLNSCKFNTTNFFISNETPTNIRF